MIGDIVGEAGLAALEAGLPALIAENALDFVVVNGENAADGFGLTDLGLRRILAAGADMVTSGNHIWEKRDFWPTLAAGERILRPANYPGAVGRGWLRSGKNGTDWLVVNIQGRELMTPIDCPFACLDGILDEVRGSPTVVLVDFHAESSAEKEALAYHADGRISLLVGTHTHVQTADERILPNGTAYITDLGMTGISHSVIGMDADICLERVRKQVMYRMAPATSGPEKACLQGAIAEIDGDSGKALSIRRVHSS